MEIIKNNHRKFEEFESSSYITTKELVGTMDAAPEYKEDLIKLFGYKDDKVEVLKVGNARQLLESIKMIDSQCKKIDILTKIKDIQIKKLLESEKAIFELSSIKHPFILKTNKSDLLEAETRYDAKNDILDYYSFAKFANYCRDNDYGDLVGFVKDYLKQKNVDNDDVGKLRLLYSNEEEKFYIRALVSSAGYKDFGVNFSVFVALMALGQYVESSQNEVYISEYLVNESKIYISFSFQERKVVGKDMSLSFSLILENDEIKRNAVSFNGLFKLTFFEGEKASEIFIRPEGFKDSETAYPVDLLNYKHSGSVKTVFEKIQALPKLIDHFIGQVSSDAQKIASITHPDDVRELIWRNVKNSKKAEFQQYKGAILNKLASISVDSVFKLFEVLRSVDELFEHDDVVSVNFWRTKLYNALVNKK